MKILITGGAGFIGSNLVRHLLTRPTTEQVKVIDDLSSGLRENLVGLDVVFDEATILDYPTLLDASHGTDAIVHLAAIGSVPRSVAQPRPTHDANITGTLNVLEAAREAGVPHVIVASSSSVYGANPDLPKNEQMWTCPMSPYAVTKVATENYAIAFGYSYGLKTLAFRFFNVYGPRQIAGRTYSAVIPQFLDAAIHNRALQIHGDGQQSRDFTYVDTVCDVICDALDRQVSSQSPVNLAMGTNISLLDLVDLIQTVVGQPIEKEFVPVRVGDVRASQADPGLLHTLFPQINAVDLQDGIRNTLEWLKKQDQ